MHPVVTLCTLHHLALIVVVFIAACANWAVVPWGKKSEAKVRAARTHQYPSLVQRLDKSSDSYINCLPYTLQSKKLFVDKACFLCSPDIFQKKRRCTGEQTQTVLFSGNLGSFQEGL